MSEYRMNKSLTGALAALLLATAPAAAPAAAADCAPLSANFELCPGDTFWAGAEWHQFGDGAGVAIGPYYIEVTEHWAGRSEGATLDADLDAVLAEMGTYEMDEGMDPSEPLLRDAFEAGPLQVVRKVQSIDMGDDMPLLMATMIAASNGARIVVMFGNDDSESLDEVLDESRGFMALIRPVQEG